MTDERRKELVLVRQKIGLYSVEELCAMFDCGRSGIDEAVKSGQIHSVSPNGKKKFIYISEFLNWMKRGEE